MKKRCIAILLALALVLSLLPMQVFATETAPDGWTPIYTLADLQKAVINGNSNLKLLLMNDIDASEEDITYNQGARYLTVANGIGENTLLNGNGHTIYNLKVPLLSYNKGTVKNLNTTIHDTPDDTNHVQITTSSIYGSAIGIAGVAITNFGTIESCCTCITLQGERDDLSCSLRIKWDCR